jgi:HD-GYP domain-containing protein (c-di-GMP phosphodiesterase class II)
MLKRIEPSQAQIGMFIHKLEGSWFSHPFWKSRFLLTDPGQLARLRHSEVDGVIIDTDKGRDIDGTLSPAAAEVTRRKLSRPLWQSTDSATSDAPPAQSLAPRSLAREFGRAAQVADRGVKVVSRAFFQMRLGKAIKHEDVSPVIEDIFASVQRNAHAFNGLMQCKRDTEYVYRHALATSALMIALGRQLKLDPSALHEAGLAGLLLDCGIGLLPVDPADHGAGPRAIPPTVWRDHVRYGHDFILGGDFGEMIARACLEHHERIDGQGYPHATPGEKLSALGRMAAICNAYDELVNDVDGRGALDPAAAMAQMLADTGAYDAAFLKAFVAAIGVYPVGSIVLLQSGRLAMVVDQNDEDPALPKVRCFHSKITGKPVTQETIDLAQCYGKDAIAALAEAEDLPPGEIDPLRKKLLTAACSA